MRLIQAASLLQLKVNHTYVCTQPAHPCSPTAVFHGCDSLIRLGLMAKLPNTAQRFWAVLQHFCTSQWKTIKRKLCHQRVPSVCNHLYMSTVKEKVQPTVKYASHFRFLSIGDQSSLPLVGLRSAGCTGGAKDSDKALLPRQSVRLHRSEVSQELNS